MPVDIRVGDGRNLVETMDREPRQLRFCADLCRSLGLGRLLDFRLDRFLGLGRLGLRDELRRNCLHRRSLRAVLPDLADARPLADASTEVVELRAVHVADRHALDLVDLRRVHRERPLYADAERLLAHGEHLPHARALALDHDALEDLDATPFALDHLEVDTHGVPRLELRDSVAQLRAFEFLDDLAHVKRGRWGRRGILAGLIAPPNVRCSHDAEPLRWPVDGEHLADDVPPRHGAPAARVAR